MQLDGFRNNICVLSYLWIQHSRWISWRNLGCGCLLSKNDSWSKYLKSNPLWLPAWDLDFSDSILPNQLQKTIDKTLFKGCQRSLSRPKNSNLKRVDIFNDSYSSFLPSCLLHRRNKSYSKRTIDWNLLLNCCSKVRGNQWAYQT